MRRFDANDVEDFGIGLDDVWSNTEIGREYVRNYHSEEDFEEQFDLIRRTAVKVAGQEMVSDDEIERALYLLLTAGHIKPRKAAPAPVEETPVDTRPRDKNGKLLSEAQIAWGEMGRWANEHSMDECRARARNDASFAQFMQTRFRQESQHPQATPAKAAAAAGPELTAFAEAYNKAPSACLRPINGVVTLNGQKYLFATFNALVDAASAAHLIF